MLTRTTIETVFVPVRDKLLKYLDELPEPQFKNEKYGPAIFGDLRIKMKISC